MKTTLTSRNAQAGQSLAMVIIILFVFSIIISASLQLTTHQNRLGWRSQFWNECIPVAEAGIEESLITVNQHGISNLAGAGWTMTNGGASFTRTISPTNSATFQAFVSGTLNLITNTVIGKITLPATLGGGTVTRTVRVTATNEPLFNREIVTTEGIDLNNQDVNCACNDDPVSGGLLSLNLAAIVAIPNLEVIQICLQATVLNGTNLAMVSADVIAQGILNANLAADAGVYYTPVDAPSPAGSLPNINYTSGGTTYVYRASGNVAMDALHLSGNQRMLIDGDTTLYISGNMSLRDYSSIYVSPGSTLRMYVGGGYTTIRDHAVVSVNDALDFQYYGLNSNTRIIFNGAENVRGLIYAPNAEIELGTSVRTGGFLGLLSSLHLNFNGAIISRRLEFTTKTTYRFPTEVITEGPRRGYVVNSWQEM